MCVCVLGMRRSLCDMHRQRCLIGGANTILNAKVIRQFCLRQFKYLFVMFHFDACRTQHSAYVRSADHYSALNVIEHSMQILMVVASIDRQSGLV